jgi:hypothetical protein
MNFKTLATLVNHKQIITCQSSSLRDIIIKLSESKSIGKRTLPSFEHEAKPSIPSYESLETKMDINDVFLWTPLKEVLEGSWESSDFRPD